MYFPGTDLFPIGNEFALFKKCEVLYILDHFLKNQERSHKICRLLQ